MLMESSRDRAWEDYIAQDGEWWRQR